MPPPGARMGPAGGGIRLAAAALVLATGACATRTAGVEQRMIEPAGTSRHAIADNQAFVYPIPLVHAPPGFPPGEPRELPPTTLCASFVVAADGSVRDVAMLAEPGCSVDGPPGLRDAVVDAVKAWRFEPGAFCDYPDAATRNRDWNRTGCAGAVDGVRPVAVTLAYAFTFEVRNGRPRVGTTRVQAR